MSKTQPSIEESTTLCLACSSSIHPSFIRRYKQGLLENDDKAHEKHIFFTNCCGKPICPSCVTANPRLMHYDPCLHCLGGVDVVASGMASTSKLPMAMDQDLFVLGDDDEDAEASPAVDPPPYEEVSQDLDHAREVVNTEGQCDGSNEPNQGDSTPVKYYLTPSDTLRGIALRFGINAYDLCRLNNLPPSTLTTMPKLLHTRTHILLPSASKASILLSTASGTDAKKEINRERERAEKKLQMVMKEVDWRVAKAYVALAEDFYESWGSSTLSGLAIDMYTEDIQWENVQKCLRR